MAHGIEPSEGTIDDIATSETTKNERRLRRGTIGVGGMVFMVIAATAPLTALASNFALSLSSGAGSGTLGWVLVVAALLFIFTAGYVVLSRHVVNTGAYFAFHSYGLGRSVGAATAFIAGIAYNMATVAMLAAVGYFTKLAVDPFLGVDIAWYWFTLTALLIVWMVGYFGVSMASRITSAICIIQFVFVGALIVAVLVQRPGHYSLDGLLPSSMFGGNFALTLVLCVLSFASYEAAAIYGEETEAPTNSVGKATYLALAMLVVLFFGATWTLTAAFDDITEVAALDPGSLVTLAANRYLGPWAGTVIACFIALSFLAAAVAFHNMAARYHFSLSRAGLLPARLAAVHARRGTPVNASHLQVGLCALIIGPFVAAGLDPLLNLFPAVSGVTSLATIYVMVGCSLSVIVAAARKRVTGTIWSTTVAPAISGLGLLIVGIVIAVHYPQVTGSDSAVIAAMPLILVAGATYGVYAYRRTDGVELENYLTE